MGERLRDSNTYVADDVYFVVAYILMAIVVITQVFYYCFAVYSYQSIKKKIIEKGRLLQIIPIVSIATVNMPANQVLSNLSVPSSTPPPAYPGTSSVIGNKEVPPPYTP